PTRHIESDAKILVRTAGDPAGLAPLFRDVTRETDHAAVIDQVTPLSVLVARSVDQPRFSTMVLTTFAAVALLLASVGLYGVVSYSVAQRRRELGIRAAIGARKVDLVFLVLREGLRATVLGIGIGLLISMGVTRFMGAILFGVTPLDGVAFASGPLVLIAVATLACALPALRAASTDPALALRSE
ncbi:MAG TPA: FtsX-like permease family protein, partial [Vicinamibacterales bacterium]|nr:FtsX-like permease family protein [Vicinamibacterales bacterium]